MYGILPAPITKIGMRFRLENANIEYCSFLCTFQGGQLSIACHIYVLFLIIDIQEGQHYCCWKSLQIKIAEHVMITGLVLSDALSDK